MLYDALIMSPLAASPVQDRRFTKSCMDSCRNTSVHSTTSPTYLAADRFVLLVPTVWQCLRQVDNRRQQGFSRCRSTDLEWPARQRDICRVVSASVSRLISSQNHFLTISWTSCLSLSLSLSGGPSSSLYYLGHIKNPGLIDWLIEGVYGTVVVCLSVTDVLWLNGQR